MHPLPSGCWLLVGHSKIKSAIMMSALPPKGISGGAESS